MHERIVLAQIGPFLLTAYGVCIAAGALLAVLMTVWLGTRRKQPLLTVLEVTLCGIAGAVLGARVLYCLAMIRPIAVDFGLQFIPRLWEGGYTLFGGVAGGLGGIALYAKIGKKQIQPLADLAAPGAALFLAVARLAEGLTTQGLGYYVFDKTYQWFPLAVRDIYGYWAAPVFVYEALAALVIAALCAAMLFRAKAGTGTVLFVALLSLSQILLDSWRSDEYIRFGFVHLNQLAAVGALGILLIVSVVRRVRKAGWTLWQGARPVLFAGIVGVLIWLEFALDKSRIDDFILYLIMTAALAVMGIAVLCAGRENRNKQKA